MPASFSRQASWLNLVAKSRRSACPRAAASCGAARRGPGSACGWSNRPSAENHDRVGHVASRFARIRRPIIPRRLVYGCVLSGRIAGAGFSRAANRAFRGASAMPSGRHVKVAKFEILKPAGDMSWREFADLLNKVRWRSLSIGQPLRRREIPAVPSVANRANRLTAEVHNWKPEHRAARFFLMRGRPKTACKPI